MKQTYLYLIIGIALASMSTYAQQEHADEHGHAGEEKHLDADKHDEHGGDEHSEDEEGFIKLTPEVMAEFGIELAIAGSGTLSYSTTLPGEVQINQDRLAHVVPRYAGIVLDVKMKIGDSVKKGDELAILEGNDSLTPFALKSMIDGTIIDKHITLGESLQPDSNVYTIANLSDVWVTLTLYQKDLLLVKKGQRVTVIGGAHLPTAQGVIDYVSPTLDEHTRTGYARLVLPNPNGVWKPGMFIAGEISTGEDVVAVVVPQTAIQIVEERETVFVETEEGFEPRPVKLGRVNRTHVEIVSGLTAGEHYVVRGGFTLKAEHGRSEMSSGHNH
jgi:cobalt-zinc-cadmium efflux system membrane fusion protein